MKLDRSRPPAKRKGASAPNYSEILALHGTGGVAKGYDPKAATPTLALLKILALGEDQIAQGKTKPLGDAIRQVQAWRREDQARWARYEKTGHFIKNEKAMAWLDGLARGKRRPCPK